VLRDYGVDGRQLLAVKSLYSCSEVCIRVGGSQITIIHRGCWTPTRVCYCHHSYSIAGVHNVRAHGRMQPSIKMYAAVPCNLEYITVTVAH